MFSRTKSKPRNCKKWIPEAALNVAAVWKSLKPAYLWDLTNDSPEDIHRFVQRLRQMWASTPSPSLHRFVDVLILNGDVFILHLERTIERLETLIESRTVLFVDVSDRCQFVERDSPGFSTIGKTVADLTHHLKKCVSHHKRDRTNLNLYEVNCPETWNLTTVNGILLGYPVVYWFRNIQEYDLHGALAMKPLCVYEMYIEPEENFLEDLKGEINTGNLMPDMCMKFKLYSFTAPQEWSYQLEKHVQDWFDRIRIMREISLYEEPVFKCLDLQTRTVVLASVTL